MRLILDVASLRLTKLLDVKLPDTLTVAIVETQEQFDSLAGGQNTRLGRRRCGTGTRSDPVASADDEPVSRFAGRPARTRTGAHRAALSASVANTYRALSMKALPPGSPGNGLSPISPPLRRRRLTKSLLPLQKIDDVNSFHQAQANLAYSQSYLVVFYIYQRFGELGFLDLLDAFASGKEVSDAFRIRPGNLFLGFRDRLPTVSCKQIHRFTILSDTMGFWIILAVVVVIGYLMVRKRKKDALDRWKEEEKYESTDFDYTGSDDEPWKNPTDNEDSEDFSSRR